MLAPFQIEPPLFTTLAYKSLGSSFFLYLYNRFSSFRVDSGKEKTAVVSKLVCTLESPGDLLKLPKLKPHSREIKSQSPKVR